MLVSSFYFSCSCPKKGAEQGAVPSSQAAPQKTKEEKTQNQACHSYGPIYPLPCDLQAFFIRYSLCVWQISFCDGVIVCHGRMPTAEALMSKTHQAKHFLVSFHLAT